MSKDGIECCCNYILRQNGAKSTNRPIFLRKSTPLVCEAIDLFEKPPNQAQGFLNYGLVHFYLMYFGVLK